MATHRDVLALLVLVCGVGNEITVFCCETAVLKVCMRQKSLPCTRQNILYTKPPRFIIKKQPFLLDIIIHIPLSDYSCKSCVLSLTVLAVVETMWFLY